MDRRQLKSYLDLVLASWPINLDIRLLRDGRIREDAESADADRLQGTYPGDAFPLTEWATICPNRFESLPCAPQKFRPFSGVVEIIRTCKMEIAHSFSIDICSSRGPASRDSVPPQTTRAVPGTKREVT